MLLRNHHAPPRPRQGPELPPITALDFCYKTEEELVYQVGSLHQEGLHAWSREVCCQVSYDKAGFLELVWIFKWDIRGHGPMLLFPFKELIPESREIK